MTPEPVTDIIEARVLAIFGDSITTDHISPAGIDPQDLARRRISARSTRSSQADFNSYGSRRGNHEVMMRGTFANIRIRNKITPDIEGGVTKHFPSGEVMSIYDAAMRYQARRPPAGGLRRQGIRHRLLARLGGQGHQAAGRARGDRRELRAHPPLQPGRHGRAAAAVQGRGLAASWASPARRSSPSAA